MSDPAVPTALPGPAPIAPADGQQPPPAAPRPRVVPAVGALLVAVAVTSVLDDAGLVEIRWWSPFVVAAVLAALAVVAITVRRLLRAGAEAAPTVWIAGGDGPPDPA